MVENIYSNKIKKGSRTYFFDIKKNERGDCFMTVTESKKSGENFERHRIIVFEEDMMDFLEMFHNTLDELQKVSIKFK